MGEWDHCFVYVILLDLPSTFRKPGVYVGTTKHLPLERFLEHKRGVNASRWVRKYGVRIVETKLVRCKNAMRMEEKTAKRYKALGYTVKGGH